MDHELELSKQKCDIKGKQCDQYAEECVCESRLGDLEKTICEYGETPT